MMTGQIGYEFDDGGRQEAGFKGLTGDCVTRAIAIATGQDYKKVYEDLWALDRSANLDAAKGPRNGYPIKLVRAYLGNRGWMWTPTMGIGTGCQVHLRSDELPSGAIICRLSKHLCAVVDGVLRDTYDSSRQGTRCVYGYWEKTDGANYLLEKHD